MLVVGILGADTDEDSFTMAHLLFGLLVLFAFGIILFVLAWKCIVSPTLDMTWNSIRAVLWLFAISGVLGIFTLMLWFIT